MVRISKKSSLYPSSNYTVNGESVNVSNGSNSLISDGPISTPITDNNITNDLLSNIEGVDSPFVRKVKNSKPYKDAYALFSPLSNKRWLQMLESIPYSVDTPNEHWTDFFTNAAENQVDTNYNYCIEQIQQLVKDYDTYVSKLPLTQATELSKVGYNSAITGDGLEVGSAEHSQNPNYSPQPNAPGLEALSALSNVILTGIPSVISTAVNIGNSLKQLGLQRESLDISRGSLEATLKNLNLSEKQYLSELHKHFIDSGYNVEDIDFGQGIAFDSFDNWFKYRKNLSKDPLLQMRYLNTELDFLKSKIRNIASYNSLFELSQVSEDFSWNGIGASQFYNEFMNLELEQFLNTKRFEAKQTKYNADFYSNLNGKSSAEVQNALNTMNQRKAEFDKTFYNQRLSFYEDWISRSKHDPVSKLCLIQALFNDEIITKSASAQGVARIMTDATIEQTAPDNPWKPSNILPMD